MWQLIIGSVSLSLVHALIPNHWLPLIAIAKTENWKTREALFATFITAFFHLLSTVLLGIIVGLVGIKLIEEFEHFSHIFSPLILIGLGLIYLSLDIFKRGRKHEHTIDVSSKKSKVAIITTLAISMFFSPCIELEVYYLEAAKFGFWGIFNVSLIYMLVTLSCIMLLVYMGLKSLNKFSFTFMEKHAKGVTGLVLLALGVAAFFLEHSH